MESTKNVIEIIKKGRASWEYDEHYYFKSVYEGDIEMTGDIWKAQRFENLTPNASTAWCNFLKTILGKHYEINIKTITLKYTLD